MLCLRCNAPLALKEAPEKLKSLFRELWISPLVMGFGVLVGTIALFMAGSGAYTPGGVVFGAMLGGIASLPFFVVSLLVAAARSVVAAWIGFGFELLLLILLFQSLLTAMTAAAPGMTFIELLVSLLLPTLMVIAAAIVPIMTIVQIHKVRELQALQRAHQQTRTAPLPASAIPAHS